MESSSSLSMKKAGPRAWRRIRNEIKRLPCKDCVKHGLLMIDGAQDVVNVTQLGRKLHDPERFARFKSEVDKAAEKAGIESGWVGREPINTSLAEGENRRPSMPYPKGPIVAAYGGNLLAYGTEVAIDSVAASFPAIIPGVGPKTLLNGVIAGVEAVIGIKYASKKPMLATLALVASGHHVTKVIELARGTGGITQFVRPAPFVQVTSPAGSPLYGSNVFPGYSTPGGAALF